MNSFSENEDKAFADPMKNFENETDNFIHLTSFDTYESDRTIGTPKRLVDRPSTRESGFYRVIEERNCFISQLKDECEKNDVLSPNQVDVLKQKAPLLQIEFKRMANGESKRPKFNGLEKHGRPRQKLSGVETNTMIYPTSPKFKELSKRDNAALAVSLTYFVFNIIRTSLQIVLSTFLKTFL